LLIRDLLDNQSEITLFTRPRRFGKTLNITMLMNFFEDTKDLHQIYGKNTRQLFNGLNIERAGEKYMAEQGKYPVIFLTLKSAKQPTFESAFDALRTMIAGEFSKHDYVLDSLNEADKKLYRLLSSRQGTPHDYKTSLNFLSQCLEKFHSQKVVILIDEYDVPLENAYFSGFYNEMIAFIRSLFESAFKTNASLNFAVLTGCLRISKESIFTGLNNLKIISILNKKYDEYFGFTQKEVDAMFEFYGFPNKLELAREWHNGYLFGDANVYNPWSIIGIVDDWITDTQTLPTAFWATTSSNTIVQDLINRLDAEQNDLAKEEIESLINGRTITKVIHEDITYNDIDYDIDNLWNFLYFTGYLTKVRETTDEKGHIIAELRIPNKEVALIFNDKITAWFKGKIRAKDLNPFYEAILSGDAQKFEEILNEELFESISYFDSGESFYHGFLLGLLKSIRGFSIISNLESGKGRCDIVLKNRSRKGQVVILELKATKDYARLETLCEQALKQIDEQKYAQPFINDYYKPENMLKYGIAFCGKECLVKCDRITT
jgi:hypothetical protein